MFGSFTNIRGKRVLDPSLAFMYFLDLEAQCFRICLAVTARKIFRQEDNN